MENKVYLIDVTNRDGVQTSRILLPKFFLFFGLHPSKLAYVTKKL